MINDITWLKIWVITLTNDGKSDLKNLPLFSVDVLVTRKLSSAPLYVISAPSTTHLKHFASLLSF